MEALGHLVLAIVAFIFEVTIQAALFVFYLVMVMFSPRYREKLQEEWDTSVWKRFSIVLGINIYSVVLVLALLFWIPALLRRTLEVAETDKKRTVTIQLSDEDVQRLKKTKEIHELVDVVGDIVKRKAAEGKEATEQDGAGHLPARSEME